MTFNQLTQPESETHVLLYCYMALQQYLQAVTAHEWGQTLQEHRLNHTLMRRAWKAIIRSEVAMVQI